MSNGPDDTPSDNAGELAAPLLPFPEELALSLPPERRVMLRTVQSHYQGPLPVAEQYAIYEQARPGTADFIMEQARREQTHRHAVEDAMTRAMTGEVFRSQWMAYSLMLLLIAAAVLLGLMGQQVLAALCLGASALGAVRQFILGRDGQDKTSKAEIKPTA